MARKKRAYHHGDLRRVLLDASIELMARGGVEDLSLREVARHAGVSPGAPYHHFASKADLLGAIAVDGFARLATAMRSARDREDAEAPTQKLRAIGEAYVRFAVEHPAHFHLMFHSTLAPVDAAADGPAAQSFAILLEAIAEVMAVPKIERRASRAGLVVLAWSLVHGAAALLLDGPLTNGLPELGLEAKEVPALVTSTFEALLSRRDGR
jgi:AcrR family transcriptional regulator